MRATHRIYQAHEEYLNTGLFLDYIVFFYHRWARGNFGKNFEIIEEWTTQADISVSTLDFEGEEPGLDNINKI